MAITALPTPPSRDDPTNFAARGDAFLGALPTFATEANEQADTVNIQTALATASAAVAGASSKTSLGAANYKGLWSSLTGALSIPASVTHNNIAWLLINNVANVTLSQPGVSADWTPLYVQSHQIGDIKQSVAAQDATWLLCDGSEYTSSTYPTLAATLPNTSYDLENSSATMFTTSAGTVVYNGTNTYVMADNSGTISSSTDAVTWVERLVPSTYGGGALTYAGGYFCLGVNNGFYYSTDGITWTYKFLVLSQTIRCVRFGAGVFVALTTAGSSNIYTSATINGSYTVSSAATGGAVQANNLFFFGTRFFVLGGGDSSTNIWSSTNGTTWTAATSVAPSVALIDMDYDGTANYVAVGNNGNIWYSSNGTSWTLGSSSSGLALTKVRFANSLWVTISSTTDIYTSTNSSTWTVRVTPLNNNLALAFGNGRWVIGSTDSSRIAHSTDAITWTVVTAYRFGNPSADFRHVPLIYAGGKFVYSNGTVGVVSTATDATGVWTVGKNQKWLGINPTNQNENWFADNGAGTMMFPASTGVITTTNHTSYTYRQITTGGGINKIDFFGGAWFACGSGGVLWRSTDTTSWTTNISSSTAVTSVNYNGSLYLATMGYDTISGKVRTSTDGITWTERTVGGSDTFHKSIWYNGAWYVHSSGGLYRSTDGINWTNPYSVANITTIKVVNNILFILSSTTCVKTTDGLSFQRMTFQGTAEIKYDIEYFNNRYIITARGFTSTTQELRYSIWSSNDGTYFYPTMMPEEFNDLVLLLKVIGSTIYVLGTNWIYTSIDGINWERFSIPRVNLFGREVALINFANKVVLHTANASFPASTTKFRVPELTLQLGAPSFIKANY